MNKNQIVVIGSLNQDIFIEQSRMPYCGETFPADSISFSGGGKGANQAVQCAKLGIKTQMIGKVGKDSFGDTLIRCLQEFGVDTHYISRSEEGTGCGIVHVMPGGDVYATIVAGANGDYCIEEMKKYEEAISQASMVILQLEIPVPIVSVVTEMANQHKVPVILNAAPAREVPEDLFSKIDYLVVNETEASFYVGKEVTDIETARCFCEQLTSRVRKGVIITLGEKGSLYLGKNQVIEVDAVHVENAIESTGAGDSYIGTLAVALTKGVPLKEALHLAAKAAAITVTRVGAMEGMPFASEVIK